MIAFLALAASPACGPTALKITPVPADQRLKERELERDSRWTRDKVAVLDVDGVLMNMHTPGLLSSGEHPVSMLVEKLDVARKDPAVKALVLRINSPGGSVTASDIMYQELQRFRTTGKPVVAMMMDVAASGGYYIACAADEIMAEPTAVTGSIGVIMQTMEFSGSMAKIGMTADAIKSGVNKDAGSPLIPMTPAQRQIFQSMIDGMYARFVEVVDTGRPKLDRQRVLELADGRVYTAPQALEAGLIDRLGSLRDAIGRAKQLAGIDRCRVVCYERPLSWHPNIYAQADVDLAAGPQHLSLLGFEWPSWLRPGGAQFMYLWLPGS